MFKRKNPSDRASSGTNRHVTLLGPEPRAGGRTHSLPPHLEKQVRGRLRLLAMLMTIAFVFDPIVYYVTRLIGALRGLAPEPDIPARVYFHWMDLGAVVASGLIWWMASRRGLAPRGLRLAGLAYEVAICFTVSVSTTWQYYLDNGSTPNLTWVPAIIILFPLILPGPPRTMLTAAILSGATWPLAIRLLETTGTVVFGPEDLSRAMFNSLFAVVFASMGARVVYRLGREVAAARALGSYHLEERLGHGGMGDVWRARHRMLARPAAIKVIRPSGSGGGATSQALARFEQEAQVIAGLRSPHTVGLFDFGVTDDGVFYYVMELLDGFDADKLVRQFGPLSSARAIHVLRQLCHSLSEAHARGVVHRDIKPANIFLCRYGEEFDFTKVLDFGLARAFRNDRGADPVETNEFTILGTPAFMAPEQALGERNLDGAVDIYATGCVAFWLLTGELVFPAETPAAMLAHHARTTPDPPSKRTELPIPEALDSIVLSCLAKDPALRPSSARDLSDRLARVAGALEWTEARARDWWTKHRPQDTV